MGGALNEWKWERVLTHCSHCFTWHCGCCRCRCHHCPCPHCFCHGHLLCVVVPVKLISNDLKDEKKTFHRDQFHAGLCLNVQCVAFMLNMMCHLCDLKSQVTCCGYRYSRGSQSVTCTCTRGYTCGKTPGFTQTHAIQ
jgi:hypothetical protein